MGINRLLIDSRNSGLQS